MNLTDDKELQELNEAVDEFAKAMKRKLAINHAKGRRGWREPGPWLYAEVMAHVERFYCGGDEEADIANFMMFSWWQKKNRE